MKMIKLTQNKYSLVDDGDFNYLNQYKWTYGARGYAVRVQNKKIIYMHRLILNTPLGLFTDHINRDRLDNRKINLRIATRSLNQFNKAPSKNNVSGIRGVNFQKLSQKWMSRIQVNKKRFYLGLFATKAEAVAIYNLTAKKYFGEF